jgi:hypothetical protein
MPDPPFERAQVVAVSERAFHSGTLRAAVDPRFGHDDRIAVGVGVLPPATV